MRSNLDVLGWKKVVYPRSCCLVKSEGEAAKKMLSRSGDLIAGANEAPLRAGPASFVWGKRSRHPPPPKQAWLRSPAFWGAQGWAERGF